MIGLYFLGNFLNHPFHIYYPTNNINVPAFYGVMLYSVLPPPHLPPPPLPTSPIPHLPQVPPPTPRPPLLSHIGVFGSEGSGAHSSKV